jgi:predicted nucleotidyltransferase
MKRKDIKETIKEYFFVNPTVKLRVRELERKLGLPLPSVIRYCRELVEEEMLIILNIGSVKFYTAHRSSERYMLGKRLFNLKSVYQSGLVEYLRKELSNPSIVLFGSFAKGEDTEESDVDLYIETPSKKEVKLDKFERLLKRKVQISKQKDISEIKNHHLANNIVNGILLNGFLEVFE